MTECQQKGAGWGKMSFFQDICQKDGIFSKRFTWAEFRKMEKGKNIGIRKSGSAVFRKAKIQYNDLIKSKAKAGRKKWR